MNGSGSDEKKNGYGMLYSGSFGTIGDVGEASNRKLPQIIDSLSHANFYLKHKEYESLKELSNQIYEMCPLNPKALKFVKEICLDVLPLHSSKYFHIGGDKRLH